MHIQVLAGRLFKTFFDLNTRKHLFIACEEKHDQVFYFTFKYSVCRRQALWARCLVVQEA